MNTVIPFSQDEQCFNHYYKLTPIDVVFTVVVLICDSQEIDIDEAMTYLEKINVIDVSTYNEIESFDIDEVRHHRSYIMMNVIRALTEKYHLNFRSVLLYVCFQMPKL